MLLRLVKNEPKHPSGWEKFVKIITFVGAVAAIGTLVYIAYQKFNEYMRALCEENCDDYLDDCCCDGTDCENCDIHDDCSDESCSDVDGSESEEHNEEPEIEVEIADESDFEEKNNPETENK
ncbi:MAG: hypothetical protein WCQ72_01655 [Eubacteriales bacterium]